MSLPNRIHAWDTETIGINVKEDSPVGNGTIICAQCFVGPDIDFGNGPRLFIDNYADAKEIIQVFKGYFENTGYLKVWHNYGFDRHILYNHGIDVKGFGGDTMHMARLADPSRMRYSLKHLTWKLNGPIENVKGAIINHLIDSYTTQMEACRDSDLERELAGKLETVKKYQKNFSRIQKIDIASTFGFYKRLANGNMGKILMMPDIELMHCSKEYVGNWIEYSCFDAEILYFLRETLVLQLE